MATSRQQRDGIDGGSPAAAAAHALMLAVITRRFRRDGLGPCWNATVETVVAPAWERWRLASWLVFVTVIAGLNYADRFSHASTPKDLAYRWSSSIGGLVLYGIMLGILLLIARGLPRREVFALRRPGSWPRAIGLAGAGLTAIWGAAAVLSRFADATHEQGLLPKGWDSSRAGPFVAFFVVVAFVGPVVEELTYRGLGFTLLSPYGTGVAIVSTGVLFGVAHGLVIALPVLIFFGLVVGWLRAKTDSVYPGMLLHSTFNSVALVIAVAVGG
jgi:membrane protease YdiL (CAAX protease family)